MNNLTNIFKKIVDPIWNINNRMSYRVPLVDNTWRLAIVAFTMFVHVPMAALYNWRGIPASVVKNGFGIFLWELPGNPPGFAVWLVHFLVMTTGLAISLYKLPEGGLTKHPDETNHAVLAASRFFFWGFILLFWLPH